MSKRYKVKRFSSCYLMNWVDNTTNKELTALEIEEILHKQEKRIAELEEQLEEKERYAEHTVAWELPTGDSVTKGNYNLADIETKYIPIQTEMISDDNDYQEEIRQLKQSQNQVAIEELKMFGAMLSRAVLWDNDYECWTISEEVYNSFMEQIDDKYRDMAKDSNSKVGTGGMAAKLAAATIATDAGVDMVIANSRDIDVISRITDGENVGTLFLAHKVDGYNIQDYLE